jgi:hypothetical protein
MATPASDLRVRYDFVTPRGKKIDRTSTVAGRLFNRKWLIDILLHAEPPGSRIVNLRAVDEKGNDLPEQSEVLTEALPVDFAKGFNSAETYDERFDADHPDHPDNWDRMAAEQAGKPLEAAKVNHEVYYNACRPAKKAAEPPAAKK